MADLKWNAFRIAKFMYDHSLVGQNTTTVARLKEKVAISSNELEAADTYLLESGYVDGTMGGDAGQRRLTTIGVDFVKAQIDETTEQIDEAVVPEPTFTDEPETGHVLFINVVGYSKLPMSDQTEVLRQLNEVVDNLSQIKRDKPRDRLIILPTGDGMAIVFFGGVKPHVDAAIELSRVSRDFAGIALRIGLHSGPVQRVLDINSQPNVSGPGINVAQRVMDCGDAGHILISKSLGDVLTQISNWDGLLHDLGEIEVKHGLKIHVLNLCGDDFGNPELPPKFRTERTAVAAPAVPQGSEVNVRTALVKEIDINLDLLHEIWNTVLDRVRFSPDHPMAGVQKRDAIRSIVLPTFRCEKWTRLLPEAVNVLNKEEFEKVDRLYSRLERLIELRADDPDRWRIEGEIIISDLVAEGNPLRK